jgi:hypothetical protein
MSPYTPLRAQPMRPLPVAEGGIRPPISLPLAALHPCWWRARRIVRAWLGSPAPQRHAAAKRRGEPGRAAGPGSRVLVLVRWLR